MAKAKGPVYTALMLRLLSVCGTAHDDSRLPRLLEVAEAAAAQAGARVERVDLFAIDLPVMRFGDAEQSHLPQVQRIREAAAQADLFLIGTPEYHGSMSGALKNWFDFLYEELAGKVAAFVATTGGGGGDMSLVAAKNSFQWCHGFVLPFHAAARERDFADGQLQSEAIRERLQRIGHDLVRFGGPLRAAWEDARSAAQREGPSVAAGFAGLHAP